MSSIDNKQIKQDRPNEAEITYRLQEQVVDLEAAVSAAKREAVQLFRELDMRMKKAKNIVSILEQDKHNWARQVSKLMDILGDCHGTMEGMTAIGLLRDSSGFTWDLEKVFDGADNDQVPS
jgi:predicted HAD superfamily Cof-like phosphohydrolase